MRRVTSVVFICVCVITAGLLIRAATVQASQKLAPATTSTTSAAANLDQCRNGAFGSEVACAGGAWVNGNAGASNAHYVEGDSISYRMRMTGLNTSGSHTLVIEWDITKSSKHAIDYITTWDRTAKTVNGVNPDPCSDVAGANCLSPTTFQIPTDPAIPGSLPITSPVTLNQTKNLGTPITVPSFVMYGGTITNAVYVDHTTAVTYAGDLSQSIQITFTASNSTAVLAWSGHIAKRQEWGAPIVTSSVPFTGTASNISGSPYHTRLVAIDGGGGNQDRSLSAAAVIATSSITIAKSANPQDDTIFPFTASPSPLSDFSVQDPSNPSMAFTGITNFITYTVAESIPSGWKIDTGAAGGGIACSLSSISLDFGKNIFNASIGAGGSSGSVTIALGEGDDALCTFYDKQSNGNLTVVKRLSPASDPGLFNLQIDGASKISNVGDGGTTGAVSVTPGSHTVGETAGTSTSLGNYTSSISCSNGTTGAGSGPLTVTVNSNDNITCTITNIASAPLLTVTKTPDQLGDPGYEVHPGGTATFTITVTNTGAGPAYGVVLSDTLPLGVGDWTASPSPQCSVIGSPAINLSCNIGTLAANTSFTATVSATVPTNYLLPPALPPGNSLFEIDGNLTVDTAGNKDWANIGINCASTPKVGCDLDKPTGTTDDSFGQGTKEDTAVPSVVSGSIPNNKSDLTRFYVANQKVSGTDFLYLAWERVQAPSGTTNMDFELNQSPTLSSNGVTPVRTAGDLLITYDLASGGTVPVLGYHVWVTAASANGKTTSQVCASSNSFPCWDAVHALNANVAGAVNTVSVTDPILASGQTSARTLDPLTFGEALINLEAAGIFPASITDPSQCVGFGQAYLKSRSSTSFTAEIKDFIAPISVTVSSCPPKFLNNQAFAGASNFSQISDTGQIEIDLVPPTGP